MNLWIVGTRGDNGYLKRIAGLQRRHVDWIKLCVDASAARKAAIMAQSRYCLHCKQGESFGIAVAEQMQMGLIPFVPIGAGPAEIVSDRRLIFQDVSEAIDKIDGVLEESVHLGELRRKLTKQASRFSAEHFMAEMRLLVEQRFLPPAGAARREL